MNNHFNLDIYIDAIVSLQTIFDILQQRHSLRDDKNFGFTKDTLTFVVRKDFENFDKDSIECLKKL